MSEDDDTDPIRIEHMDGQWTVQILEGGQTTQHLFESEVFARNFADGQRIRLALGGGGGLDGGG